MNDEVYFDDSDDVTCLWHCSFDEQRRALTMDVMLFVRRGERLYESSLSSTSSMPISLSISRPR